MSKGKGSKGNSKIHNGKGKSNQEKASVNKADSTGNKGNTGITGESSYRRCPLHADQCKTIG